MSFLSRPRFKSSVLFVCAGVFLLSQPVHADNVQVTGKVIMVEGHLNPACRRLQLKRSDGVIIQFRIPDTGTDQSMLSVTTTALASGLTVIINYDPSVTSGCGPEPRITYVSLLAPG